MAEPVNRLRVTYGCDVWPAQLRSAGARSRTLDACRLVVRLNFDLITRSLVTGHAARKRSV